MTTERRLTVRIPTGTHYIDLARLYSAANHRLMPQNKVFEASIGIDTAQFASLGQDVAFSVDVIPTTWPIMSAYKHGRSVYQNLVMKPETTLGTPARWHPKFRIFYDINHCQNYTGNEPLPLGVSYTQNVEGEYQYTRAASDTGTYYHFAMFGDSYLTGPALKCFGLVDQYDRKDDTNIDAGNQVTEYSVLLNDQSDVNANELIENGNLPPYNKDNLQVPRKTYHLHAYGSAVSNVGYTRTSTGNIEVPFGLLKVSNLVSEDRDLIITFKAGSFKGISVVDV